MINIISANKTDLRFSQNGDFIVQHGDLLDTFELNGLGFIEEVELRIKSSANDWYFDSEYGASLHVFEGRMITPALLENIKESIVSALTYNNFLTPSGFNVQIGIIDIDEVAVKIIFSDNIRNLIDYKIQDVRIIFDLKNGTPRVVRS